jgi:peroxiredoxin Q/BCP
VILGISYDTPAENAAFRAKFSFNYPLLSDPDAKVAKAYGAFQDKEPGYPMRNTYVIDAHGKIEQALVKVPARTHPKALLDMLG